MEIPVLWGMSFDAFLKDDRTYDAVIRNLEIIGEAAKNVTAEFQADHPAVAWRKTTALRNIIAHEYFGVKDEIIWDIIQKEIPELGERSQNILD
jgi:uncharacterized protein with HEPN domain